jgi:hypothetical protein
LAAEWELIMLSALARVGVVEYEPALGGDANLDFTFSDSAGLNLTGDITMLSDDDVLRRNPVNKLADEVWQRLNERRLRGGLHITIEANTGPPSGKDEVLLMLPAPHEFKAYIFDAAFDQFVRNIAANPNREHTHAVRNSKARLSITFRPGRPTTTISHLDFRSPRDIVRNPLYNRLAKKLNQIKKSGHISQDGLRGVLVCDGGSSLFAPFTVGVGTFGLTQIAHHFLRKTKSLHFVAAITVKDTRTALSPGGFDFDVRIIDRTGEALDGLVGSVLREGLRTLPRPIRSPPNARLHVERQLSHGLATLDFSDAQGATLSDQTISLSARAVIDYVAGRIDRQRFEVLADSWTLSILRKALDSGNAVHSLRLVPHTLSDDDDIILEWRRDSRASSLLAPTDRTQG